MISFSLTFQSCNQIFEEVPSNDKGSIFENFWQNFQDDYALFEERGIEWNEIYAQYRPLVNFNTTDEALFGILSEMIKPIEDGHVALMAPGIGAFDANPYFRDRIEDNLFDLDLIVNNYLEPGYKQNGHKFVYGKIKNHNMAYLHFDVFRKESVKLDDLLREFAQVDSYIIDLRHNNGGDVSLCFSFLGRFTEEKKLFLSSKTKNGKGANDYTAWFDWHLNPSGKFLDKHVYILTDRYTVSAAERMVMAAKTVPKVLIVGDTTNGTFGTKISRELANGWFYSYSIQKVKMFDGQSYEGIGLPPDIYVKNEPEEMKDGRDSVLEKVFLQNQ